MRLSSIKLPKTERFAASPATVRRELADIDQLSAYLGALGKTFSFDPRCRKRPKLGGPVVASIQVSRDRTAILQLYPVKVGEYPDEAAAQFAGTVLPYLKTWLTRQLEKPDAAVLGYQEIIVEWFADEHRFHEIRFL
jgi:hypothetical protein